MILFLALCVSLSCGMIDASTENLASTVQNSDTTKTSRGTNREINLQATERGTKSSPTQKSRRQSQRNITLTRQIAIKQGILRGVVRHMHPHSGLRDVDQFLGVPYAEPPINNKRFMPPGNEITLHPRIFPPKHLFSCSTHGFIFSHFLCFFPLSLLEIGPWLLHFPALQTFRGDFVFPELTFERVNPRKAGICTKVMITHNCS